VVPRRNNFRRPLLIPHLAGSRQRVRKLIAFDDDTFDKLKQLARDRMGTVQELADEAFADLLRKHGIPVDLKDALRKSASLSKTPAQNTARSSRSRKRKS
jgi:non-homologous end joining protein Ku